MKGYEKLTSAVEAAVKKAVAAKSDEIERMISQDTLGLIRTKLPGVEIESATITDEGKMKVAIVIPPGTIGLRIDDEGVYKGVDWFGPSTDTASIEENEEEG